MPRPLSFQRQTFEKFMGFISGVGSYQKTLHQLTKSLIVHTSHCFQIQSNYHLFNRCTTVSAVTSKV
jgi:hypothetical protein